MKTTEEIEMVEWKKRKLDQIGFWFEIKLEKEKKYRLIIWPAERRD